MNSVLPYNVFLEAPGPKYFKLVDRGTNYPAVRTFYVTNHANEQDHIQVRIVVRRSDDSGDYEPFLKYQIGPISIESANDTNIACTFKMRTYGCELVARDSKTDTELQVLSLSPNRTSY
jgi:hypothetical protein